VLNCRQMPLMQAGLLVRPTDRVGAAWHLQRQHHAYLLHVQRHEINVTGLTSCNADRFDCLVDAAGAGRGHGRCCTAPAGMSQLPSNLAWITMSCHLHWGRVPGQLHWHRHCLGTQVNICCHLLLSLLLCKRFCRCSCRCCLNGCLGSRIKTVCNK